jgi:bifunctional enzyme CysN/CysC/sulfate adenylyltransferase subunit 1
MNAPLNSIESILAARARKELVRLVVIGSVDDGKSTLIGRLLYETGALYDDQIEQVRRATRNGDPIDFSLFTDGLKAEREQGITIDVAYRFFETAARKFILADTPGHAQYTRNMATGASTADAAVILVDARLGLLPQTRRHATLAALLGIPRLGVAINKMDLVGFAEARFHELCRDLRAFAAPLGFTELSFFPISARDGDNVAAPSTKTPWYQGTTVLGYLTSVPVGRPGPAAPLRFPVQTVVREGQGYRGLAGQLASGEVAVGDELLVLPAGTRTRVRAIDTFDGPLQRARAPLSVVLRLTDEVDAGRGDLIAHPGAAPLPRRTLAATAIWLSEQPFDPARALLVKQTTRTVPARLTVETLLDPESGEERPAQLLRLNELGRVRLDCARPLLADGYAQQRSTGAAIAIDALTNETVAALLLSAGEGPGEGPPRPDPREGAVLLLVAATREEALRQALLREEQLAAEGRAAALVLHLPAALAAAAAGLDVLWPAERAQAAEARAALDRSGLRVSEVSAPGH